MCYSCHGNLSAEHALNDWKSTKQTLDSCDEKGKTKMFEQFNSTSVSHMCISAFGVDGDEARQLALEVLNEFIKWNKTRYSSIKFRTILFMEYVNLIIPTSSHFRYLPNLDELVKLHTALVLFDRATYDDGKYANLSAEEFRHVFFGTTSDETNNASENSSEHESDNAEENVSHAMKPLLTEIVENIKFDSMTLEEYFGFSKTKAKCMYYGGACVVGGIIGTVVRSLY